MYPPGPPARAGPGDNPPAERFPTGQWIPVAVPIPSERRKSLRDLFMAFHLAPQSINSRKRTCQDQITAEATSHQKFTPRPSFAASAPCSSAGALDAADRLLQRHTRTVGDGSDWT